MLDVDLDKFDYNPHPKITFLDGLRYHIIDFIQTLVVFGAIFSLIYLFVAQFHKVSGQSMFPTMHNKDFLITEKLSFRFGDPKRGQIVVLKNPQNEAQDFIKRIIGLPGDTIKIENSSIFLNGVKLNEPYLPPGTPTHGESFLQEGNTITVPENKYFVVGDNREHSSDSRDFGPVDRKKLIGRGLFRYWPPQRIGILINK